MDDTTRNTTYDPLIVTHFTNENASINRSPPSLCKLIAV